MSLEELFTQLKGGKGSGNYGHSGRKGKRGGSAPKSFGEGTIIKSEVLPVGINRPELLTFEDGTQAVWKPWVGNDSVAEVAAYEIGQKLGIDVPETKLYLEKPGTIQKFVKNAQVGSELSWAENERLTKSEEGKKIAAFDYVIGNVDRHDGNWLLKNNKIIPIDNGASLTTGYAKSNFLTANRGQEIPQGMRSKLDSLDSKFIDSIFENMKPDSKFGRVSLDEAKQGMKDRIQVLKETGRIPKVL